MTLEFAIAFGGPLLVCLIGLLVAEWLRTSADKQEKKSLLGRQPEVDEALAVAQAAAHQAEVEIARARERLAS